MLQLISDFISMNIKCAKIGPTSFRGTIFIQELGPKIYNFIKVQEWVVGRCAILILDILQHFSKVVNKSIFVL